MSAAEQMDGQALVLATALELMAAGMSVIPVTADGSKRPAVPWRAYTEHAADEDQVRAWFDPAAPRPASAQVHTGLGVVSGPVSGQLVMVEVEGPARAEALALAELAADSGLGELWRRFVGGWCEGSPAGGLHWWVRVAQDEPVAGNTKLAWGEDGRATLAETRGAGGFTVVYPTDGRHHPSANPWRRLWGGPQRVPVFSNEELQAVLDLFRTMDQRPAHVVMAEAVSAQVRAAARDSDVPAWLLSTSDTGAFLSGAQAPGEPGEVSPGDDYAARTDWRELLEPAGWQLHHRSGRTRYWTRPGKDPREGPSATTGHSEDEADRLYVFSSSTEFPAEQPLSKFYVYAVLFHGGDMSAAASTLRAEGYGSAHTRVPASPERNAELARQRAEHETQQLQAAQAAAEAERGRHLQLVQGGKVGQTNGPAGEDSTPGGATATAKVLHPAGQPARKANVSLTDSGNALALVERHGHELRYVTERGVWLRWNAPTHPGRWSVDAGGLGVLELMRETVLAMEVSTGAEAEHRAASLGRRALSDAVSVARGLHGVAVSAALLDADPLLLGTPAGVVDLRTGAMRPADPEALVTRASAVVPDASCPTPRWSAFLGRMFKGQTAEGQAMIAYVRRLFGLACSGLTSWHVLPFLHGPGANGKSVLAGVMTGVLGEYAATAPAAFLMAGLQQHSTEVARLQGVRLLVASEVDPRARFDESKVKLLTGGDRLTARFMRGDFVEFKPTHTMFMLGNHLPRVESGGQSFWRRLRLLHCGEVVPEAERIADLEQLLVQQEGPGILAWALAGLRELLASGALGEPVGVLAATAEYQGEEDALAQYVAERLRIGGGPAVKVRTSELRADYEMWCVREGYAPLTARGLGRELPRFDVERVSSHGTYYYTNVSLAPAEGEGEQPRGWFS